MNTECNERNTKIEKLVDSINNLLLKMKDVSTQEEYKNIINQIRNLLSNLEKV